MGFKFDIGLAVQSGYDDDGFLSTQRDAEGELESGVAAYETHHFGGFIHRNLDPVIGADGLPDPTKAGKLLFAMEGGRGHAWALDDPRVVPDLPALKPGESLAYGAAGNFVRFHEDGAISIMTTDTGKSDGRSVYIRVAPDAIEFIAPWGTMKFNATGLHVLTRSGASFDLGSIGGLPAPLDAIATYANIQAGMVNLNAGMVSSGPTLIPGEPAVKAYQLLLHLGRISAALAAISSALVSASSPASTATSGITAAQSAAAVALTIAASIPSPLMLSSTAVG